MESKLYQEVEWICSNSNCKNINTNTFLEIETHPVECVNCHKVFDVYLKVKLDIEVLEVSDGTVTEENKKIIRNGLKKASDSGKITKAEALEVMSKINLIK